MSLHFRLLTNTDLHQIEALQQQVCAALDDPNSLQPLSEEEIIHILNGNGLMIGVFDEERCIAFRALLKPQKDEDEHLGIDVGATDLERVLYQEISNVHPAYRGQNLQQRMAAFILQQVDLTAYDWMCATVMPFNIASLKDKFSQNMYVYALKLKYGGKLRYVFGKRLTNEALQYTEHKYIPMDQTEAQQKALAEGFIGQAMFKENEVWFVEYIK